MAQTAAPVGILRRRSSSGHGVSTTTAAETAVATDPSLSSFEAGASPSPGERKPRDNLSLNDLNLYDDETLLESLLSYDGKSNNEQALITDRFNSLRLRLEQDLVMVVGGSAAETSLASFWSWLESTEDTASQPFQPKPRLAEAARTHSVSSGKNASLLDQSKGGKDHLEAVMSLLSLPKEDAAQLSLFTLRNLTRQLALADQASDKAGSTAASQASDSSLKSSSSYLRGLLGTQSLLAHCVRVYYAQRLARVKCLLEMLRLEQLTSDYGDEDEDGLPGAISSILTTWDASSSCIAGESTWLFQSLLTRAVVSISKPTYLELRAASKLVTYAVGGETDDEKKSEDSNISIDNMGVQYNPANLEGLSKDLRCIQQSYIVREREQVLHAMMALQYQRCSLDRQGLKCLYRAFASVHFFSFSASGESNQSSSDMSSHLAALICMEAVGLWRVVTAQGPSAQITAMQTLGSPAQSGSRAAGALPIVTLPDEREEERHIPSQTPRPRRNARRKEDAGHTPGLRGSKLASPGLGQSTPLGQSGGTFLAAPAEEAADWLTDHPLLEDISSDIVVDEFASLMNELCRAANSTLMVYDQRRKNRATKKPRVDGVAGIINPSSEDVLYYPQSVALLSLGLLLRLAFLRGAQGMDSLALKCVEVSNESLAAFDYLQIMLQNLLPSTFAILNVKAHQDEATELDEDSSRVACASIVSEVVSALVVGFYSQSMQPLPLSETLAKREDIAFLSGIAATVYRGHISLAVPFWNEFHSMLESQQEGPPEEPLSFRDPICCLLQTCHLLAGEGIANFQRVQSASVTRNSGSAQAVSAASGLVLQTAPYLSLLSALCGQSIDWVKFALWDVPAMCPPEWLCSFLHAAAQLCTNPSLDGDVAAAMEEGLRSLANLSSVLVGRLFMVQALFLGQPNEDLASHEMVHLIYRIALHVPSSGAASNALLFLARTCAFNDDAHSGSEKDLGLEGDDTSERLSGKLCTATISLLVGVSAVAQGTQTPVGCFGVFADLFAARAARNQWCTGPLPLSILALIRALSSRLDLTMPHDVSRSFDQIEGKTSPESRTKIRLPTYASVLSDGFKLGGMLLCATVKEEGTHGSTDGNLAVAVAAMNAMSSVLQSFHTFITKRSTGQGAAASIRGDLTRNVAESLYSVLVDLNTSPTEKSDIIGLCASLPVSLGWFAAMDQCREAAMLKRQMTESNAVAGGAYGAWSARLHIGASADGVARESMSSTLERRRWELIHDLSGVLSLDHLINNDGMKHMLRSAANSALGLLRCWSTAYSTLLVVIRQDELASNTEIPDLSPCDLLGRGPSGSFHLSFLASMMSESAPKVAGSENVEYAALSPSFKTSIMWPIGVPYAALLCGYFLRLSGETTMMGKTATGTISDLLQICVRSPNLQEESRALTAYYALARGFPLHSVLAVILKRLVSSLDGHSQDQEAVNECTKVLCVLNAAITSEQFALSVGILLGNTEFAPFKIECLDYCMKLLHASRAKLDSAGFLELISVLISVMASLWKINASTGKQDLSGLDNGKGVRVGNPRDALSLCAQYLAERESVVPLLVDLISLLPGDELSDEDVKKQKKSLIVVSCIDVVSSELLLARTRREEASKSVDKIFCDPEGNSTAVASQWTRLLLSGALYHPLYSVHTLRAFLQVLLTHSFVPTAALFEISSDLMSYLEALGNKAVDIVASGDTDDVLNLLEQAISISETLHVVLYHCSQAEVQLADDTTRELRSLSDALGSTCSFFFAVGAPPTSNESRREDVACEVRSTPVLIIFLDSCIPHVFVFVVFLQMSFTVRLHLTSSILLLSQMTRDKFPSPFSYASSQSILSEKTMFADLLCRNISLLRCKVGDDTLDKNSLSFLELSATAIILLLPVMSAPDVFSTSWCKQLVRAFAAHKLFDDLAAIFDALSATINVSVAENDLSQSGVPVAGDALEAMACVLRLCQSVVTACGYCGISHEVTTLLLGPKSFLQCLTCNSFLKSTCMEWQSWTMNNDDMRKLRGYRLTSGHREVNKQSLQPGRLGRAQLMQNSGMLPTFDFIHKIWREIIQLFTAILRNSKPSSIYDEFGGQRDVLLDQESTASAMHFLRSYDGVFLSAILTLSIKEKGKDTTRDAGGTRRNIHDSTSANPKFTRNGLLEASDCMLFLAELLDSVSMEHLAAANEPRTILITVFMNAIAQAVQNLGKFLGSSATAHELFRLVEQGNSGRRSGFGGTSPLSKQRVGVVGARLHPLMRHGIQHAKHEAISHAHYVSSCCSCMTDDDYVLSKQQSPTGGPSVASSPTKSGLETLHIHIRNRFTMLMENKAAAALAHGVTFLARACPMFSDFVPFGPHEIKSINFQELLDSGVIVGIRGLKPHHTVVFPMKNCDEVLRLGKVCSYNKLEAELSVKYMHDYEMGEHSVPFSNIAGVVSKSLSQSRLTLLPANESISNEKRNPTVSIGDLMQVLHWCSEQAKSAPWVREQVESKSKVLVSQLAEKSLLLLVNQISLHAEQDEYTQVGNWEKINEQLFLLLVEGDPFKNADDQPRSPLASIVSHNLWLLVTSCLSRNLASAEIIINDAIAREAQNPSISRRSPVHR
jgi:hypothetical protein